MYDVVRNIIGHIWDESVYMSAEQQMIFYICGSLIVVLTVWILDAISHFIINLGKKRG